MSSRTTSLGAASVAECGAASGAAFGSAFGSVHMRRSGLNL